MFGTTTHTSRLCNKVAYYWAGKPSVIALAGVISLVALAVVVGSLSALHLLPTGLSPVRNAVSQYGITGYRALYRSQPSHLVSRASPLQLGSTKRCTAGDAA